jgi:hypothetical protein
MTLQTIDAPEFDVTVKVNTVLIKGSFSMRCVGLPGPRLKAMEDEARDTAEGPLGMLCGVVKGHDPLELFGETVEFSGPESVKKLLGYQGLGTAMMRAYHDKLWEEASGN